MEGEGGALLFSSPRMKPPGFSGRGTDTLTQVQSHRSASPRRGRITDPLII